MSHAHPDFKHMLLIHDTDGELLEGVGAFVREGLTSGGDVLVLNTEDRLGPLREAFGAHQRLEYGSVDGFYESPMRTLFSFQRQLAERVEPRVLWATGTVPLGEDAAAQGAWNRYESAATEALAGFPFRGLCAFDTRTCPPSVIAAARATHPAVIVGGQCRDNADYVHPADFLGDSLAQVPEPPTWTPCGAATVVRDDQLRQARELLWAGARAESALPSLKIELFILAVHEVAINGLVHGAPPVHLTLWADAGSLTCLVQDDGPGSPDPVAGLQFPGESGPLGLWTARQMVDDLFIGSSPSGGCSVLLTVT